MTTPGNSTVAIDARTGLHVVVRPLVTGSAVSAPEVGALLRANDVFGLLGAISELPPLYPSLIDGRVADADELRERARAGALLRRVPELMHMEGRLLQLRHARGGTPGRPLPSLSEVAGRGELFVVEPLVEWALVTNLVTLGLSFGDAGVAAAVLGDFYLPYELDVPVCHNPGYRMMVGDMPRTLDERVSLPLLARLRSGGGVRLRGSASTKSLHLNICGDYHSIRDAVLSAVEGTLSASGFVCEGRPIRVPDGAAAGLWVAATSPRDVRLYVCEGCGRLALGPARGKGSKYCSNACRAAVARADGRWERS